MAGTPSAAPAAPFPISRSSAAVAALGVLVVVGSAWIVGADPRILWSAEAAGNALHFVRGMFPPRLDAEFLGLMVGPAIETVQISVVGTAIAVAVGFPLGLVATSSLLWRGILHERQSPWARRLLGVVPWALARALLSIFRSIPEFVWAFMFVRAVGLGPFPGVLAIGIAYGGVLGKVYSEILEGVDPRPLEALRSAGATRFGVVFYGLVPEALPHLVSYTLYRWECAIRASAILGFVGAGGLGQQIELSMRMFRFDEVLTLVGVLFTLVAVVDFVSGRIRERIVR